jgi:hypothetical protein
MDAALLAAQYLSARRLCGSGKAQGCNPGDNCVLTPVHLMGARCDRRLDLNYRQPNEGMAAIDKMMRRWPAV